MKNVKVTAILTKYKRLTELDSIYNDLKRHSFIDEIIVWDNTVNNTISFGKFVAMSMAKNEIIYTQDDDCIVTEIERLFDLFDGTQLVNGCKAERLPYYTRKDTLIGWGTFIRKEWIKYPLSAYIARHGMDHIFFRETDRIFTSLIEVPRMTIPIKIDDFPSAMASFALSLQHDHDDSKMIAISRCLEIQKENEDSV